MDKERRDKLEKAMDPRTRPVQMTLREAEVQLSNAVYKATDLVERLEGAGLVSGNGHHARQKIAEFAVEDLRKRWKGPRTDS